MSDDSLSEELAESIRVGLAEENLPSYSPEEAVYILKAKLENRSIGNPLFARDYDWTTTFTTEFEKHLLRFDKTLQGRILEAVMELSKDPLTVKGDTQKPLKHDFKGCWDHRTGHFRIIYEPEPNTKNVRLVTVEPRGSAYK